MSTRKRFAGSARYCPHLECLEERTLLNNRFVVPLAVPADNATHFHTLLQALTPTGLSGGDVIQIQLGSSPGDINQTALSNALAATGGNLSIQGDPAAGVAEIPAFGNSTALSIIQPGFTLRNLQVTLVG